MLHLFLTNEFYPTNILNLWIWYSNSRYTFSIFCYDTVWAVCMVIGHRALVRSISFALNVVLLQIIYLYQNVSWLLYIYVLKVGPGQFNHMEKTLKLGALGAMWLNQPDLTISSYFCFKFQTVLIFELTHSCSNTSYIL